MKRYNVPRIIFINKLDRAGANPWNCIEGVRERLGLNCAAVQVNIGVENGLQGVIDLLRMKAIYFEGEKGETPTERDIPKEMLELVNEKK